MFEKLKNKWEVKNNSQFWLIMFIFSIAGSSTLFVKKPVFELLGIDNDTSWWFIVPLYIIIVTPAYFVILLSYGTIFGQFRFFWEFEKKIFSRVIKKKTKED